MSEGLPTYELQQNESFFSEADDFADLAQSRLVAFDQAVDQLNKNYDLMIEGEFDEVPLPIDVLSDADRYVQTVEQYGEQSEQALETYKAVLISSQRAIAEAMRAKTWEYFPTLRFDYDQESKDFYSYGLSVNDATLNGLSPIVHKEEQKRRIYEHVENATHVSHAENLTETDSWYLTISMCAEHEEAKDLGYVPELDKMMVRGVHFGVDENGQIYKELEQVSIPGLHISENEVAQLIGDTGEIDRSQLLNRQFLIDPSEFKGVIDVVEALDYLSEKDVFMGEEGSDVKSYNTVHDIAMDRQKKSLKVAEDITNAVVEFVRIGLDPQRAKDFQMRLIEEHIHMLAEDDPTVALHALDEDTALRYKKANDLERAGDSSGADAMRDDAREQAPDISFCGAGSCGLVGIAANSSIAEAAAAAGLDVAKGLVNHKAGKCGHKNCNEREVIYDKHGNAMGKNCGHARVDGKIKVAVNIIDTIIHSWREERMKSKMKK